MALDLLDQVAAYCQKNDLLTQGDKVVVGVSGGPDSLCLLHVLTKICHTLKLAPPTVAHLNHQLRSSASDDEAKFVQDIANQWQLPFFGESRSVADYARRKKLSIEEAARQLRYAFLKEVATKIEATKIAVGHNADDQAETVLMHFLRGSGLTGLRGMLPQISIAAISSPAEDKADLSLALAPSLIRPLLDTPRQAIEEYCQVNKLEPRYDTSNQDTTYFRNRLRHELLPQLEQYNPNIRQLLNRTAKIIAADVELIELQIDQIWPLIIAVDEEQQIGFQREVWLNLPVGLKRAILRRAIDQLQDNLLNIGFEHIDNVITTLERGQTGASITLPGELMVRLDYQTVTIGFQQQIEQSLNLAGPQLLTDQPLTVKFPGVTVLPATNWQLRAEVQSIESSTWERIKQVDRWETFVDAALVKEPVMLRTRQPGDRFYPLGLGGQKKIKDFMIDAKIPEAHRNQIPILVSDETILWLCGYRLGDRFKVTPNTLQVIHFKFEPYHHPTHSDMSDC